MTAPAGRRPLSARGAVSRAPARATPLGTQRTGAPRESVVARWDALNRATVAVCGAIAIVGILGVVGGRGWVWPVLFLVGVGAVGVLVGQRPWLVAGLTVSTGALLAAPTDAVGYVASVWMWVVALVGAAAVVGGVRRCVPDGPTVLWRLALLLPTAERESWRAEFSSVLHACSSDAEARRQVIGYLTAMPATIVASWRYRR